MKSGRFQYLRFLRHVTALTLFCAVAALGQASDKIISVGPNEAKEGEPLTIHAELAKAGIITQMLLAYRPFGASEYKKVEMTINGNTASATIPGGEVAPSAIDYYLLVAVQGVDTLQPYPVENPEGNPLQVQVRTENPKDKMVIFLSPEPNTSVRSDDLLISVSLYRTPSSVNRKATKIYIDDRDVTLSAGFIEDIITLSPENIKPPLSDGPHTIKVELFDNEGKLYYSSGMSFAQLSITEAEVQTTKLNYKVSAQLESRNETISNVSTPYNRGTLNLTSDYGPLKVNGGLYLTNEDRDDRQPQNRYSIEALTSWLRVGYGDAYPTFPSLIMSGKRLRGLTSNLKLGFFNLDFATGETVRRIEGDTVYSFPKDSLPSQQRQNGNGAFGPVASDTSRYALYRYGTFTRNLTVVRPSFGSGQTFQWGFSYLKAKDDTSSILYGFKPQENVALGTDLFVGLDNRHIELNAQGAASVINQDIKPGTLSNDDIDSLYKFKTGTEASAADSQDVIKKRNDLKDIKDKISPFITVNQNLIPLSIDKLSSVMAYEGALALNYFDNYLKGSYIFRGSEYNSFGQTYVRNDVQGYNVFDRIRLMESQLFLSVGVEQLQDNTDGNKIATTTFTNDNATVSYFPRSNFPNITVGYSLNKNSNDLIGSDTTVTDSAAHAQALQRYLSAIEDKTDRFFIQLGYAFTAGVRHNASLTISTSDRNDRTFRHNDANNTFISASLNTTWNSPLQTMFGFSVNLNQLPKLDPNDSTHQTFILSDFNYSSITLNARYPFLENRLMLSGTISPTFGDFNRMVWDMGADYSIRKDLVAAFQLSLFQNSGSSTDMIGSLMLKYNM
ncbi:MAG: hypothetical protein ABSF91_03750 [Bacteroidota bacterium]